MNETILNNIVENMKKENLNMETIYISCKDKEYKYIFNDKEELKNIRSISKTVTSLALGIAIDKGYIKNGIEENIMQYLNDVKITNKENIKYLEQIKIKHLVTLSMGYQDMILNESHLEELGDKIDLLEFALNYPLKHKPGEFFKYTNAPIYILSNILEKVTGMKLSEFVNKEIFKKIEINNFDWLESKQGHSMGCTGLKILPKDLQKIAKLILNNGKYKGEQIIPIKWIEEMTKVQINTPNNYDESRALPKYRLWI